MPPGDQEPHRHNSGSVASTAVLAAKGDLERSKRDILKCQTLRPAKEVTCMSTCEDGTDQAELSLNSELLDPLVALV